MDVGFVAEVAVNRGETGHLGVDWDIRLTFFSVRKIIFSANGPIHPGCHNLPQVSLFTPSVPIHPGYRYTKWDIGKCLMEDELL